MPKTSTSPAFSASSAIAQSAFLEMRASGHARIIRARSNADIATEDSGAPPSPVPSSQGRESVTYHSTGVQTLPPSNAYIFKNIYGREPTDTELERKIGLAAYGRYEKNPGANPHELVYGPAFEAEQEDEKRECADSGFQTVDFTTRALALKKARAKASMTAGRFTNVAANCGYRIWAEPEEEKVVHSEQHPVCIAIQPDGNVKDDEDITGRFLPNLYKEELAPKPTCLDTPKLRNDRINSAKVILPHPSVLNLTPPMTPPVSGTSRNSRLPLPVAALAPSARETTQEYGDISEMDEDYYSKFIVYNHDKCAYKRGKVAVQPASRKRKSETYNEDKVFHDSKRLRIQQFKNDNSTIKEMVRPTGHYSKSVVGCSSSTPRAPAQRPARSYTASSSRARSSAERPNSERHDEICRQSIGTGRREKERKDRRSRRSWSSPEGSRVTENSHTQVPERRPAKLDSTEDHYVLGRHRRHGSSKPDQHVDVHSHRAERSRHKEVGQSELPTTQHKGSSNFRRRPAPQRTESSTLLTKMVSSQDNGTQGIQSANLREHSDNLKSKCKPQNREEHKQHVKSKLKLKEDETVRAREDENRRRKAHNAKKGGTISKPPERKRTIEEFELDDNQTDTKSQKKNKPRDLLLQKEDDKYSESKKTTQNAEVQSKLSTNSQKVGPKTDIHLQQELPKNSAQAQEAWSKKPTHAMKDAANKTVKRDEVPNKYHEEQNETKASRKCKFNEAQPPSAPREERKLYVPRGRRQNAEGSKTLTTCSNANIRDDGGTGRAENQGTSQRR